MSLFSLLLLAASPAPVEPQRIVVLILDDVGVEEDLGQVFLGGPMMGPALPSLVSVKYVALDQAFDDVRDMPEFQALMEKHSR